MSEAARVSLRTTLAAALASSLLGLSPGCAPGPKTMGELGLPSPARVGANIFLVEAEVDGHGGANLIADSGSPVTLVDGGAFPGASLGSDPKTHCDLGFGALVIDDIAVIQSTVGLPSVLGGIVGGDVMRDFSMGFDYRGQTLRFGDGADPQAVAEPGATMPFSLEGGGDALFGETRVSTPTTRITFDVDIEGLTHPFMLDTGASETTVRYSVFSALMTDGRPILEGLPISTVSGPTTGRVTRTQDITVAGQTVGGSVVMTADDDLLNGLSAEIGHSIDGLLGGSFLREFFVVIDYPNRTMTLHRYADRSHITDEFVSVGLQLGPRDDGSYEVNAVYKSTVADMQGVSLGDQVLAIDGTTLASLDPFTVGAFLLGPIGAVHAVSFGTTDVPLNTNKTLMLPVEDLVPSP